MTIHFEAIYTNGVLRPVIDLDLDDGTRVEVTAIKPIADKRTPYEILSAIASLPLEVNRDEAAGRNHDAYLYDEESPK